MHPQHRLRRSAHFQRARREGRSWNAPLLVLSAVRNDEGVLRCGFSVSRRVGSAVVRNRLRRRLRELLRQRVPRLPAEWDLVFTARPPAAQASYVDLAAGVDGLLQRARLAPLPVLPPPPPVPAVTSAPGHAPAAECPPPEHVPEHLSKQRSAHG